ncbi:MAG: cytochrome c [Lutibacter sp.]|uniref:c-type cytochrome n=1 Tax=Lutibacter sp. TaxID=1925666 RepID=UPI00299D026A|nr:cytochrome c [Lutibacter sp.]MDX1829496.1 cytochrome c [Lutibacter sp.]
MKLKLILIALVIAVSSCGNNDKKEVKKESPKKEVSEKVENIDPMLDKGVGPITSVTLGEIDESLAAKGKEVFKAKCTACHKINKRYIGPALKGVTKKQSPEWIMNMILNPEVMIAKNKTAKELLREFSAPMANQHLTKDEARAVLEYFRTKN